MKVVPLVSLQQYRDRVRLAVAILAHRPWCEDCLRHVAHVERALRGESIEQIAGTMWKDGA